jgi:hypothetical protein
MRRKIISETWEQVDAALFRAVHDSRGRFFCSTTLSENNFIKDLHDYADGVHGGISHCDFTAFHESDSDLAAEFLEIERRERNNKPSYPR